MSTTAAPLGGLKFDRGEWAGAFGDLGTLLPFLLAYVSVVGLDPGALLCTLGLAAIGTGVLYRTPLGVQPMKVIGVAVAAGSLQGIAVTPQLVYLAGLLTGLFWLLLGATNLIERLARLVAAPVMMGLVLGLGLAFMRQGVEMMAQRWWLAALALGIALLVKARARIPSLFLLLLLGAAVILIEGGGWPEDPAAGAWQPRLPDWHLPLAASGELWLGAALLVLAQLPLTFGNAIVAAREQNNRQFPARPTSSRRLALSTGAMNLLSAGLGGMPLCHGAGGMAAQLRFGARSGGAPVIFGGVLLLVGLLLAGPALGLAERFPPAVLGVMLLLAGAQLALNGARFQRLDRGQTLVLVATAGVALWNVGVAFLIGALLHALLRRNWLDI